MTMQHDAFRVQRKSALYWIRTSGEEIETLDMLEDIMPEFVKRRYRISTVGRSIRGSESEGTISLLPLEVVEDDVKAADALHADVTKLLDFLSNKCEVHNNQNPPPMKPIRKLAFNGLINYEFALCGLPNFEAGLHVTFSGLPAGSACHITKTLKGTRTVEDYEYEMVCDDEVREGEELERV